MGAADIVPGVSGGTIALIVGIYERLINGIKELNINFLFSFLKYLSTKDKQFLQKSKKELFAMDFALFIPLGLGIGLAFGLGSLIIKYLLHNHPAYIFAFFFGLILGSIRFVYKLINKVGFSELIIGMIAFIASFLFVSLNTISANHSLLVIFFSGMIAICAMILPGISGSFVLLFLGQYEFMLDIIHNILYSLKGNFETLGDNLVYLITFGVGAVIGLLGFSRVISFLLKRYHSITMAFLVGLMLGSLKIPFDNIVFVNKLYPEINFVWGMFSISLVLILMISGVVVVLGLENLNSND